MKYIKVKIVKFYVIKRMKKFFKFYKHINSVIIRTYKLTEINLKIEDFNFKMII